MFYYIKGQLVHLEPGMAVLEACGVGYQLTVSQTTYDAMPPHLTATTPPTVKLFTHFAVREDGVELYGFATETELSAFRMLISVSGVGPKAAMSVLSLLSPEKFALAVCTEDRKLISKANGVGPKTAARIVLELKDKLMKEQGDAAVSGSASADVATGAATGASRGKLSDATDTLLVLGFSRPEILTALKDVDIEHMELQDIVKAALKKMQTR